MDALLRMIAAFGQVTVDKPLAEAPSGRTVQVVVNIFQAGAIAAPFTQGQGVNMSDQYNVSGSAGAVGRNASASNFTINQDVSSGSTPLDLEALASQLTILRTEMRRQAESVEEDAAVLAVGSAQLAAEAGDQAGALTHLRSAGTWAAGVATSLGVAVAAGAIKAALGM